jgi:hypothetical protein
MKRAFFLIAALNMVGYAYAAKPCEELKSEIAAKIEAQGVKSYELNIVEKDKVGDATVVGSCDGGTKKITYVRK